MRHEDNPTAHIHDFEMIAIDPSIHGHQILLAAFRAGNITLAEGLMLGGDQALAAQLRYETPVETLGVAVAASNKLK
jgi:homoserine acetyltransferase